MPTNGLNIIPGPEDPKFVLLSACVITYSALVGLLLCYDVSVEVEFANELLSCCSVICTG